MVESVRSRAPGRVNLIGEHTDYNSGFVLPFAIGQGCVAEVSRHSRTGVVIESRQRPGRVVLKSTDLEPGSAWIGGESGWAAYAAGVLWALAERGHTRRPDSGLTIRLDSDVPVGAGLSSSAAVACAVASAIDALLELSLGGRELAAVATAAEARFVGAPTGGMDQLISMLGVAGHALFCDMRGGETKPVPLTLKERGLALLVIDSRAPHKLVEGEYRQRRRSCEEAAAALGVSALRDVPSAQLDDALRELPTDLLRKRTRHVVTENDRVLRTVELLQADRIRDIGPVLVESHESMRDDFEITVDEIDVAVDSLMTAGAVGARMTGGGFGGCVIALIDSDAVEFCADAVVHAFKSRGYALPSWFCAQPGDGARVLSTR